MSGGSLPNLRKAHVLAFSAGEGSSKGHRPRMPSKDDLIAVNFILQAISGLDTESLPYSSGDGGLAFLCDCRMHNQFALLLWVALPAKYALRRDFSQELREP